MGFRLALSRVDCAIPITFCGLSLRRSLLQSPIVVAIAIPELRHTSSVGFLGTSDITPAFRSHNSPFPLQGGGAFDWREQLNLSDGFPTCAYS